MNTSMENNGQSKHDEIARVAKLIWEREGRESGRDLEYWLRAERELLAGKQRTGNTQPQAARPAMATPSEAGNTLTTPTARPVHTSRPTGCR